MTLVVDRDNPTLIDADVCIEELIKADGNFNLAAERLFGSQTAVSRLVAIMASDEFAVDKLNRAIRILTTLSMFKVSQMTNMLIQSELPSMEHKDMIKVFQTAVQTLSEHTDSRTSTQNINVTDTMMRHLPSHVRRAMMVLVQDEDSTVIENPYHKMLEASKEDAA